MNPNKMKYNPEKHHRRSIRLKGYDYSQAGCYYVTIVNQNRECLFGDVVDGEMVLNELGKIVQDEWLKTAQIRKNIELDIFVVMPNHVHGIIIIDANPVGVIRRITPTKPRLFSNSLGSIIGQFKSVVTKRIHKMGIQHFKWQRNYWEHVIRDENELNHIQEYIINNPLKWDFDDENPNSGQPDEPPQQARRL